MKHLPYKSYKNSGIEWMGDIPESWVMKKLKFTANIFASNVDKKTVDGQSLVSLCNYTDVYYNEIIKSGMDFMAASATDEQIEKFLLKKSDVIITKDSETPDDIGIAAYVPEDIPGVICGYHLSMIRPKRNNSGAFIKRVFDSHYVKSKFETLANGVTRYGLGSYAIDNLSIPLPPYEEQKAIANFLDRETAKIDELIQKQKELIELLEIKRQAVIYRSVTKGLNGPASLKESKISWIGETPSHWVIGKVKNYYQVTLGKMLQPEQKKESDMLVSYLRAANIQVSGVDISDVKEMWLSENELKALALEDGDVLVSEGGDVGRCSIWNGELDECYFQNSINRVRPKMGQLNKFFYYWMIFAKNTGYIDILCNKSTIAHLTAEKLSALPMVFPPIEEQTKITNYLDKMFLSFDALITKSKFSISLLKQHRASLISAAVTGKIDVRELV